MSDEYIKREDALNAFNNYFYAVITAKINNIPSADVAPVRHEEDGTLWVTVGDCEKVGRVIVKNEQGHFCRTFYMGDDDGETERHGHWIKISPAGIYECSECGKNVMTSDIEAYEYCHGCGARMDEEANE